MFMCCFPTHRDECPIREATHYTAIEYYFSNFFALNRLFQSKNPDVERTPDLACLYLTVAIAIVGSMHDIEGSKDAPDSVYARHNITDVVGNMLYRGKVRR